MACEPDDAPLFSRAEPAGTGFTDDGALDCWVLVFGLGPDDAPHALTALAQHGDVLEHERGAGNWLFAPFASTTTRRGASGSGAAAARRPRRHRPKRRTTS